MKVIQTDVIIIITNYLTLGVDYQRWFIFVRSFPGAKTDDMESYIKPRLKNKPERIIIQGGNNNLKNNALQSIADNISSLAKSSQQENNIVLVYSIVRKKDHLDKKGKEVNIVWKKDVMKWTWLLFLMVTLEHVAIAIITACI